MSPLNSAGRGLLVAASLALSCVTGPPAQPSFADGDPAPAPAAQERARPPEADVHSAARPDEVAVTHMDLRLSFDFASKTMRGEVTHHLQRHELGAPLKLDARGIEIERVELSTGDGAAYTEATHEPGPPDPQLGTAVTIPLADGVDRVRITYRTSPDASGLQWLEPTQTAGGKHPFLYSQAQAIHARSFVPCQDTPSVRVTFDATVDVPDPLVALMAAQKVETPVEAGPQPEPGWRRYAYRMPQPVPSYLVAIAAGDLEFRALSERTGVWAEPSVLPGAADELADMEQMLRTAETLYGPYRWGRFDVLVLPPAFPFGGMENPRLTFATPTILAGDRSLVSLVAHELAHSWSGNLVTNATWGNLWLNEGFTVYIERRIVEALYGRERAQMEAVLGYQDLVAALEEVDDADEHLVVDLTGRDPDDGLGDVAYEKGALLLRQLELTYGRPVFDPFLRRWFTEHAFSSVLTAEFERFAAQHLVGVEQPRPGKAVPDLDGWIHAPGIPAGAALPTSDAFAKVDAEVEAFATTTGSAAKLPVASWSPYEWLHFLRHLPADLPAARLAELDDAHRLTQATNYEILAQWLEVAVRGGHRPADTRLERFLLEVGRRKFLVPLYQSLLEAGRKADAQRIYAQARPGYHTITRTTLDALVGRP